MKSIYQNTKEVYNKLGKSYLIASKKVTPVKRLSFSQLFNKGDKILDVGCGGGRDAKFFTQRGLKVTGIDFSPVLINLARKEAPKANFKCMDLLKINFPRETFDGIWAEAVLLHLKRKDVPKAIKLLKKVLKKNGVFYFQVKEGKGEAFVKDKLSGGYERFYTYFSKKEMENILRKMGFKIIYSEKIEDGHKRAGVSWIACLARK